MSPNTDRIEKKVLLMATRERVWRALSEAEQFGTEFGVDFDGPLAEGERPTGRTARTRVDDEAAAMQQPYVGTPFDWIVGRVEPMPFGLEKTIDSIPGNR
ncbi:MAG: hypothetical protein ACRET1_03940 [Burkholderiales bacterium]